MANHKAVYDTYSISLYRALFHLVHRPTSMEMQIRAEKLLKRIDDDLVDKGLGDYIRSPYFKPDTSTLPSDPRK